MTESKRIKERLLFSTLTGSRLFGTDSENSDTDIKGIFLPDITDLILKKASNFYDFSTNKKRTKNTKEDIDEKYFSLQFFMEHIIKGDMNFIDILFANTNKKCTLHIDPLWEELIKNTDKLISKNITMSLRMFSAQCIKNYNKTEKINLFIIIKNYIKQKLDDNKSKEKLTLESVISKDYNITYDENKKKEYKKGNKVIGYIYAQNINGLFDDFDIVRCFNNENFMIIKDIKIPFNEKLEDTYERISSIINNDGKKSEIISESKGIDYKILSHCVRIIYQVEELISNGKISFPLKDKQLEFVRSIKFKITKLSYNEIIEWINQKIEAINNKLIPESNLRDESDKEWIDNFILKCYDYK